MHTIGVASDDELGDHGAQLVVDLVAEDDESEEAGGGEEVDEDDQEPRLPRREPMTRGTRESSPAVEGAQVQGGIALSSEDSQDPGPRGPTSWTHGGTQVQRRATSSLGRRSRDNLSSEGSRDSNPRDKRLRLESSPEAGVPSSPPNTSTPGGQSSGSSWTPGKPVPRRFLKQENVPARNQLVYILAKKLVQAEVLACHPWPNTSTIEVLIRRCWANAITIRAEERSEVYVGANYQPPTKEPDEIALEIVSSTYLA